MHLLDGLGGVHNFADQPALGKFLHRLPHFTCSDKSARSPSGCGQIRFWEALIQSARTVSERFFVQSRYRKRRNTLCTREGYAASVSRLMPATAAQYFPLSIPKSGRKRSAHSRRRFSQSFPLFCGDQVVIYRLSAAEQIHVRVGADVRENVRRLLGMLSFTSSP